MNRRDFLKATSIAAVSVTMPHYIANALPVKQATSTNRKPNFLFILIDDMGWSDLVCYGHKFHQTPNIDRLAKQGMRFTDAYAAAPVCSPTRASILAGQYPARIGITDFIPGHYRPWAKLKVPENRLQLPLESVTIAEVLKDYGYATACIGKWHLGAGPYGPQYQGFDLVGHTAPNLNDKHVTAFTNQAIKFITQNSNKPFFLYLSHHTVHIPLEAPQELIEKYQNKRKPATGVNNPIYAAMLEHLDNSIGRIMTKLDQLKIANHTVVIFFSDNGGLYKPYGGYRGNKSPVTTNAPLRSEKGTLYEGGIRVPLIIRWPGTVKPATICADPVTSADFYPTALDILGARTPKNQPLDGQSILPLLTQTGKLSRPALFWHYPHYHHSTPAGAIRQGPWKLIQFFENNRLELYNLKTDIAEKKNLAKKMSKKARELQKMLAEWRKAVGAKMPAQNPDYDPAKAHQWGRRQRKKPRQ